MKHRPSILIAIAWVASVLGLVGCRGAFLPPQSQILGDMVLANNRFTNEWPNPGCAACLPGPHASCIWTRATYIEGALALYGINHDTNIYNYAVQWGAFTNWNLRYGDTDKMQDDQSVGAEYLELYSLDPNHPERITHIVNNLNFLVGRTNVDYLHYVDSLHMVMQAFARAFALTGNTNYSEKLYAYFHFARDVIGSSNGIYNAADHLWYRDTNYLSGYVASDGTAQKCYWSRGNGWAFVALARVLEVLPANDPHYAEYRQTFQQMAAALKAVQRSDGFWNVNLGYANDYPGPEASGTACFTYGFAWGIRHGLLDRRTYLPSVIAGWNALANNALHHSTNADNGFLGYVQGTGSKPADSQPVTYTSVPNFDDFGLGLFLLAGSEVYQLSAAPGITLAPPVLTNQLAQLDFTVISTQTDGLLNLLEASQLDGTWTTNPDAVLTTNLPGAEYRFVVAATSSTKFYRVELQP
ncbi:MAG TPA: glycoside hydrolase family 88 protein [Verrucomicrobiae bacterium]|nr:glycoside hydrolase family 88 protein [Verrucomicrobiae bacterium]